MSERKGKGIESIISSNALYLTPQELGDAMGWSPDGIRAQAQEDPSKLGFRVTVIRKRAYIPRIPFLKYYGLLQEGEQ